MDQKNANFLIADPGATSENAVEFINEIKDNVAAKLGVNLEIGIEIW